LTPSRGGDRDGVRCGTPNVPVPPPPRPSRFVKGMQEPIVSVVVPTKNRAGLLRAALESVRSQSFERWECLVVDDGSTDDTAELLAGLASRDTRFRTYGQTGAAGACARRNQGAAAAAGEYLVFLDSDDLLEPWCLKGRVGMMARNLDLDFCVFQGEAFGDGTGGRRRPFSTFNRAGDLDRFLYRDLPWEITSPIWRREAFAALGGFDERLPSWQDVELHIRSLVNGQRYLTVDTSDHSIRWQNDPAKISLRQRHDPAHLAAGAEMVERVHESLRRTGLMTWTRQRALVGWQFMIAERHMRHGRHREAWRTWERPLTRGWMGRSLFLQGLAALAAGSALRPVDCLAERAIGRWKGLLRLRDQPALV